MTVPTIHAPRCDATGGPESAAANRFVHLIDAPTVGGLASAIAAVAALSKEDARGVHAILLMGASDDEALAKRCLRSLGAAPIWLGRIVPPLREAMLARRAVHDRLEASAIRAKLDLVVAWGVGAWAAVTHRTEPTLFIAPVGPPPCLATWWVRRQRIRRDRSHPRVGRATEAIAWSAEAAVETEAATGIRPMVLAPTVDRTILENDAERGSSAADPGVARVRWSWGAGAETIVVGLFSDPPAAGDLRRAAEIVGFASVRGADVRLIAHPSSARRAMTMRWLRSLVIRTASGDARRSDSFVRFDARIGEPWRIADALDVGLLLGDGVASAGPAARSFREGCSGAWWPWSLTLRAPNPAPAAYATAAGLPLIADIRAFDRSLEGEGVSRYDSDDPLAGTRSLLALCANPSRRDVRRALREQAVRADRGGPGRDGGHPDHLLQLLRGAVHDRP